MPAEPAITTDPGHAAPPAPVEFRRAMAEFATGVTVVTGLDGGEPVGFACQSFASVSLEPPLVLFCADHRGRSWPRIRASGRFCVNILAEDQRELCERFGSSKGRKFQGLEWEPSPWGAPALPDVLLRVHAVVQDVHVAGDHDVVIGRVLSCERPPGNEGRRPLLFFRSRFGIDEPDAPIAPDPWARGDRWG
ncbi:MULTISPECIES: flavin reductase family protein [Thermomonospora]|uniref:Flavin reductase domain protein FMN-binding protein n=1 Tax=Thermomonospora curvata (strain ATCC 19995 / DSM 43183 / JCM 3096 / KCTC 9072 / NBRC 15933 / NCIMB 10081 / Henssen B9) TaxID=471852 RepID=D1ABN6_THECD|nr:MULTISPECIES: flavin reductase family protein [Thermomonospora]ACY99059.1 flavin reductase domain protein FMN-binding protein [Thermomonospora curvata DSM 43183]PKK13243.1 MAG: flavin reductase [Thermomonospora sp. CIF 1]